MEPAQPQAASSDRTARLGAAVAGAGGLLLFGSLFLTWYKVFGSDITEGPLGGVIEDVGGAVGIDVEDSVNRTGWESFEITDVVCAIAGIVAFARAGIAIFGESDDPPIPGSVLTLALGAAALALVIYRIVNPPGVGEEREIGVWIGAFAAGSIVYGSYVAMQSDKQRL